MPFPWNRMERGDAPDDRRFDPVDYQLNAEPADDIGAHEARLGGGIENCPGEVSASRRIERNLTREDLGMAGDGRAHGQGLCCFPDDRTVEHHDAPNRSIALIAGC